MSNYCQKHLLHAPAILKDECRCCQLEAQLEAAKAELRQFKNPNNVVIATGTLVRLQKHRTKLAVVREMEVPTGYSAKFTHGWGSCLQTVKAAIGEKDDG